MNTIRRLLFLALPLALLASCGKDGIDEGPGGGTGTGAGEPIKFEIGFAPMTRVATDGEFKSTWEEGDEIGVFASYTPSLSTTGNPIHNAKLTYSGGEWSGVYWPTDSEMTGGLYFIAYYPYDDNGGSPEALNPYTIPFNVASDQREQTDHNCSDLLVCSSNGGIYTKGDQVTLSFRHSLSMIELTLDNQNRVIDPAQEVNVTLKSVYSGGELRYSGVFITDDSADPVDILMHRVEQPGNEEYNTTYTFRAFLPRQIFKAGERKFVIDNGDITLQSSALGADVVLNSQWAEPMKQTLPASVIKPQAEANSYMATPHGRALLIPVSQANRILNGEDEGADITGLNQVEKDNFTVELVWGDSRIEPGGVVEAAEAVEIDGEGYIRVFPGRAGNAVIGIKLTNETDYRWSWHIWVTEPIETGYDTETGLTWMDRNLGAGAATPYKDNDFNEEQWVKTLGLYYQWGRKDAFPGSNGTNNNQTYYTPSNLSGTTVNPPTDTYTDLYAMVQNPLNFATNYSSYRGSVNVGNNNNSWGGVSREKTVYDPCPPGWKVPLIQINGQNSWGNSSDWGSWVNSGQLFYGVNVNAGLGHYYPASGYRNYSNGQLDYQGTQGRDWSASSSTSSGGYYLYFGSGSVSPANSNTRSFGYSVRCVAE